MKLRSVILIVLVIRGLGIFGQQAQFAFDGEFLTGKLQLNGYHPQYESKFKLGVFASANRDLPIAPKMSMHSGLQYATFSSVHAEFDRISVLKASYLMLPVTTRFDLSSGVSMIGGMQFGRLIKAKRSAVGLVQNIDDSMPGTDVFVLLGLQYRSGKDFSASLWYQRGLMDNSFQASSSLQNRGFGIELSYQPGWNLKEIIKRLIR